MQGMNDPKFGINMFKKYSTKRHVTNKEVELSEISVKGLRISTLPSNQLPLHKALISNQPPPAIVTSDINAKDISEQSALHLAVQKGKDVWVEFLLKHGADPNLLDKWGMSAIMLAAKHQHPQTLETLIDHEGNVNLVNSRKQSALHFAAGSHHVESVRILLSKKAKVNLQDSEGVTPLLLASMVNSPDIVKLLLNYRGPGKANPNLVDSNGRSALHWCAQLGRPETALALIQSGADINAKDMAMETPFVRTIKSNNLQVLDVLVEAGCDRNDIDGLNGTAMTLACLLGRPAIVQKLIDLGDDVDELGHVGASPLSAAAFESHVEVVHTLLRNGADPNIATRSGATPLMKAIFVIDHCNAEARHEIIASLLRAGADPDLRIVRAGMFTPVTNGRNCALSLALMAGYPSIVRMLLIAGARVSCTEITQWMKLNHTSKWFEADELLGPICSHVHNPHSLRHTTRTVIRRKLATKVQHKIKLLPVPTRIQWYLNMGDLSDIPVQKARMYTDFENTFPTHQFIPCSGAKGLQDTLSYDIYQHMT